jgi:hypothetical protein
MLTAWALVVAFQSEVSMPLPHGGVSKAGTAPVEMHKSVAQYSIDAMTGDPEAASKLSDYYLYEKNMDPKWKYWALVAAENGDAQSQFSEYNILAESGNLLDQRRALYWLKRSAEGGFVGATVELQRCFPSGAFESKQPGCLGPNQQ